jgi:hypothetical protein
LITPVPVAFISTIKLTAFMYSVIYLDARRVDVEVIEPRRLYSLLRGGPI